MIKETLTIHIFAGTVTDLIGSYLNYLMQMAILFGLWCRPAEREEGADCVACGQTINYSQSGC